MKLKTTLILLISIVLVSSGMAQDNKNEFKTIFKKDEGKSVTHGGYGSIGLGYTKIDGRDAITMGGRMAWILNHHIAIGVAGNGFFNSVEKVNSPGDYYMAGGYGGLFVEPILMPSSPVHVSFPIIFGLGGVVAKHGNVWEDQYWDDNYYDKDAFLVFEPGAEVEFNVVKFFRISLGASYRMTNGVVLQYKYYNNGELIIKDVPTKALDAFNFNLNFKFGWF
jgi:hypothetical protein